MKKKNGFYRNKKLVLMGICWVLILGWTAYIGITEGMPEIIHNGRCLDGSWAQASYKGLGCT